MIKVNREMVASCMTCPLCDKLFRDATTIPECLHTFCRKCIYKKLTIEEMECCPICKIDLGCVPLEKLRPDHNLQDVRAKLFPHKRRKVEAPEVVSPTLLPLKIKERSLSSLVVSAPKISAQGGLTGRRSKYARKAAKGSSFSVEKSVKQEESIEGHPHRTCTPEILRKFVKKTRKNFSSVDPSSHCTPDEGLQNVTDPSDFWNPLTCLVDVANGGKQDKLAPFGSVGSEILDSTENDGYHRKSKFKENGQKSNVREVKNSLDPPSIQLQKPKKLQKVRQKKKSGFGDLNMSPQAALDTTNIKSEKRMNPIWFSLVASEDQEGDAPLPQISASYLRIKNGNVPVSVIQKYLVRKLDLRSEDEVEIRCMGRAIVPTWQLNHLVDLWLQSTTSERASAEIGSSAEHFVMVLAYARKVSVP
ncbi:hypothetical protein Leryth_024024 [Lithospermum erythrorhizon]|nr:hypothetical protein Leryth_024024 [Lithospermum erythrorhizon]